MGTKKRLIDANALNRKKKYSFQTVGGCFPKNEWFIKAKDLFAAPTVDAVEVVRCKDCKQYGNFDTYRCKRLAFSFCRKFGNITRESDFCSYGERKDE